VSKRHFVLQKDVVFNGIIPYDILISSRLLEKAIAIILCSYDIRVLKISQG